MAGVLYDPQIPRVNIQSAPQSDPGIANRRRRTRCIKAWHERGDFLVDIAVICMKPDHGKRTAGWRLSACTTAGPDLELRAALGFQPLADGDDDIEIVVSRLVVFAIGRSYPEFPDN